MKLFKNWLIFVLAIALLGSLALTWSEHAQGQNLRAIIAQDESAQAQLQAKFEKTGKAAQALRTDLAAAQQAAHSPAAIGELVTTDSEGTPGSNAAGGGNVVDRTLAQLKDPQVSKLMTARARTQMGLRYSGLLSRLKMTPQQNARLLDILAEKQTAGLDIVSAATENGVTDMKELGGLMQKTQRDLNNEIKSLIGDQAYAQYQQYSQAQVLRDVVGTLEQSLATAHTPLSRAQYNQMVQILAQTGPQVGVPASGASSPVSTAGANPPNNNPAGLITNATITQAESVLQPFQLQTLKMVQKEQQLEIALKLQMARNPTNPGAGTSGTP